MKTEMIKATDLVGAIHDAFRSADSCHCQEDGKLSEVELTRLLAMRDIIPATLLSGPLSLTLDEVGDGYYRRNNLIPREKRIPQTVVRGVSGKARFLHDLRDWTYGDLLKLAGVGAQAIEQTERAMAAFGFLLKDGDPARLEPEPEPETEGQAPTADPGEVSEACAEELIALATEMVRDGASLMKFAGRMGIDDTRVAGLLKKYTQRNKQTSHQKVMRVAGPWIAMVDSERARQKERAKRSAAKRATRPVQTEGNVVRAAFGG